MDLRTKISAELKIALKDKDSVRSSTIRLIMAALKDRDIAARSQGHADGIPENDILSMLGTMIKQRQESMKTYRDAGREELAVREEQEIKIIQEFLPAQLSEAEVEEIIGDLMAEHDVSEMKDMGKVMAVLKSDYAGQIDMAKASSLVRKKLG